MKVYKYLPFSEGSKRILSDGTMKFSHYSDFNDPFDCKTAYDIEKSMEYVNTRPDIFSEAGRQLGLSKIGLEQTKDKMLSQMRASLETGEFHEGIIGEVGICCLTKTPDNLLMWSHYADNHKGFVIEFTLSHKDYEMHMGNVEEKLFGWDVEYSNNMPMITAGTRDFNAVKDVFLTKSLDWKYESEYRVLAMQKGPGIHNIDRSMITKVIGGVNISDDDFDVLKSLVHTLSMSDTCNPKIIKAQMSRDQYRLEAT
ncbi:DUF2971 domain-containing protein [Vibrio algicola]|uniref:DUF2971 domain-containing protein n=1 Tax=Vibrio algicola TaxID=2662262 RepID=UPI001C4A1C39|nr:DUF2971 domain-containing protein [Vibrio algicola]